MNGPSPHVVLFPFPYTLLDINYVGRRSIFCQQKEKQEESV